jgi:hypothetical protein
MSRAEKASGWIPRMSFYALTTTLSRSDVKTSVASLFTNRSRKPKSRHPYIFQICSHHHGWRYWWQNPSPLVAAVMAGRKSGSLCRAVYHGVANEKDKNLKDCVHRIDGADAVRLIGGFKSKEQPHSLHIILAFSCKIK